MRSSTLSTTMAAGGASGTERDSVTAGGCSTTRMGPELARSFGGSRERLGWVNGDAELLRYMVMAL